ncbi:MAG: DJ-1/PfpI family protein [Candidatus Eremiobacteraeota bacterium]|nr:DJ-1/PfpI family protein [Candidatus Eremiobacteraeota bacterium]
MMNRRDVIISGVTATAAALAPLPVRAIGIQPDLKPPSGRQLFVAFVIGKNANVMDIAGPWETLQDVMVQGDMPFSLGTVSDSKEPVDVAGRIPVSANFTYDDVPQPDIILMGAQQEHSEKKLAWIQRAGAQADIVASICTGAFLLAKTGLLDGLKATTHHDFYDKFEQQFPKVTLVRGPRYVENGKLMTAGGLTSGIELGLRIIQRYFGDDAASQSAQYMEYNRSPQRPNVGHVSG